MAGFLFNHGKHEKHESVSPGQATRHPEGMRNAGEQ